MTRLAILLAALSVTTGCASFQVHRKAEWLCKHDQLNGPSLPVFDPEVDLSPYVAKQDLQLYQNPESYPVLGPTFSAIRAIVGNVGPYAGPIIEASADATRCEVGKVAFEDDHATVPVKRQAPKVKADVIDWLAWGKLPTRQERLERARQLILPPDPSAPVHDATLRFIKTDEGWRATWREPPRPPPPANPAP